MKQEKVEFDQSAVMWTIGCLILGAVGIAACHSINKSLDLPDDHPLEQVAEKVVEKYLDLPEDSIDFTPGD